MRQPNQPSIETTLEELNTMSRTKIIDIDGIKTNIRKSSSYAQHVKDVINPLYKWQLSKKILGINQQYNIEVREWLGADKRLDYIIHPDREDKQLIVEINSFDKTAKLEIPPYLRNIGLNSITLYSKIILKGTKSYAQQIPYIQMLYKGVNHKIIESSIEAYKIIEDYYISTFEKLILAYKIYKLKTLWHEYEYTYIIKNILRNMGIIAETINNHAKLLNIDTTSYYKIEQLYDIATTLENSIKAIQTEDVIQYRDIEIINNYIIEINNLCKDITTYLNTLEAQE